MKFRLTLAATMFAALANTASAETCAVDVEDPFDLEGAQIVELYACLEAKMLEGYQKGDNEIAKVYRDWAPTATRPAVAGPHSNAVLMTFANDVAAEQYLKFEEEGVVMPVGSILAKESFRLNKKKKVVRPGALFLMEKVAEGTADEFGNWVYSAVQPNRILSLGCALH